MSTGSERAYNELRRLILQGEFGPGEKLSEVALSTRLGISRTPVREALRQLGRDGLVELEPNRGARVARWGSEDLAEIFPLRATLEGYGAARAARYRSSQHLVRLDQLLRAMDDLATDENPNDVAATRTSLNHQFHQQIVEAAASPRLAEALRTVIYVPLILKTYSTYSREALVRSQQQHRDLYTAIAAGDQEWARVTMTAHILGAFHQLAPSPQ